MHARRSPCCYPQAPLPGVLAPLVRNFEDLMREPVWNLPMIERISFSQVTPLRGARTPPGMRPLQTQPI
jgi:hypothetical protein